MAKQREPSPLTEPCTVAELAAWLQREGSTDDAELAEALSYISPAEREAAAILAAGPPGLDEYRAIIDESTAIAPDDIE